MSLIGRSNADRSRRAKLRSKVYVITQTELDVYGLLP
jgi:hypothetical protein